MSPWKSEVAYPSRNLGMNSPSEYFNGIESRELGSQNAGSNGIHKNGSFLSIYGEVEAKHRLLLVQWLSGLIPSLYFPINVTDGELRACLSDGTVLCQILNKLRPGTVSMVSEPDNFLPSQSENVRTFLRALDAMGLPRFEISDLEKGSMKAVVDCLLTLRAKSLQNALGDGFNTASPRNVHGSPTVRLEPRRGSFGSRLQNVLSSGSIKAEPSPSLIHHVGLKFHEVFQLKPASYADLPASKISEMLKSNSLDNAPTQSLLSVVDGILEESVARRNGEIPHRVVCLLKKVTQEIERRISTQAEHLRTQNNLFKAREEKYQSRIRVLEALASGNGDESELLAGQLPQLKIKEEEKVDQKEVVRLMKEQVDNSLEISALKQDLEIAERTYEVQFSQLEEETRGAKAELTQKVQEYEHQLEELRNKVQRMKEEEKKAHEKEEEDKVLEISALKEALEKAKSIFEVQCSQLEEAKGAKAELTHKLQEYERQSEELKNKAEKIKEEEKKAREREKEHTNLEISTLKQELETTKIAYEVQCLHLEAEAMDAKAELSHKSQEFEHQLEELRNTVEKIKEEEKRADREIVRLMKEQENKNLEISALKQELETSKKSYEIQCSQLEGEANGTKAELRQKSQEYEHRLEELRNKVKELEASSHSEHQKWNMKLNQLQTLILFQFSSLQTLKLSWESIKQDVVKQQMVYADECSRFGVNLKSLVNAAENYHVVLAENRQLFNEVQELKGNIRVYCRIKPFLLGKKEKQSIVDHIGENDLVIANPTKEGRDVPRSFKFTKVFGPTTTQAEVYSDIQSFVRSVLDGYNVCIFAYGQTGSGKTYTMTGPNGATSETIGVNFRALNDLFKISTSRSGFIAYDIGVQMVEIYNEQVRDLLTDGSAKRLGILTHSQPNGLAVPDASMFPVKSPSDVIKLMDIGFKNRAVGATAMNERSSRSHSVVSIHVRGKDLKSGSSLVGNLHLVDLAGSERVDRSEVTGERLREAQHINKSLSALGDVIFSLSQKSSHIPYRNSKLTQLLQTSLGGQSKTLMFVQINSDVSSFSETVSTLKFAERVSGIELGAAKSSKEGKEVKELMEQVACLKNALEAKDEEFERLKLLKGSVSSVHKQNQKPPLGNVKRLEANKQPMDDHIHQNEVLHQSELSLGDVKAHLDERCNNSANNGVAPGTETDGSENSFISESAKSADQMEKSKVIPKSVQPVKKISRTSSIISSVKESLRRSPSIKKSVSIGQLKSSKRWQ